MVAGKEQSITTADDGNRLNGTAHGHIARVAAASSVSNGRQ